MPIKEWLDFEEAVNGERSQAQRTHAPSEIAKWTYNPNRCTLPEGSRLVRAWNRKDRAVLNDSLDLWGLFFAHSEANGIFLNEELSRVYSSWQSLPVEAVYLIARLANRPAVSEAADRCLTQCGSLCALASNGSQPREIQVQPGRNEIRIIRADGRDISGHGPVVVWTGKRSWVRTDENNDGTRDDFHALATCGIGEWFGCHVVGTGPKTQSFKVRAALRKIGKAEPLWAPTQEVRSAWMRAMDGELEALNRCVELAHWVGIPVVIGRTPENAVWSAYLQGAAGSTGGLAFASANDDGEAQYGSPLDGLRSSPGFTTAIDYETRTVKMLADDGRRLDAALPGTKDSFRVELGPGRKQVVVGGNAPVPAPVPQPAPKPPKEKSSWIEKMGI